MIESFIASLIKATVGMAIILIGWLAIQIAFKRAAGVDRGDDALAGRLGCHGCGCQQSCKNEKS